MKGLSEYWEVCRNKLTSSKWDDNINDDFAYGKEFIDKQLMYKIFTDSLTGVVGGAIRNKTGHWKGKQFIIFVYYLVYVLFIIKNELCLEKI